ncbi:hypothetical protein BpHYR1_035148 [Brachionus plicatilis]|uniref:Uncharacterized protein n=1 Tax=Brachionus plicatilis TaxID=10195 RepID=A0A3M7SDS4_BRAPC|nr:hypothetical protein BpHYR1_035148 [Brachionus plicatilis]
MVCSIGYYKNFKYNFENALKMCDEKKIQFYYFTLLLSILNKIFDLLTVEKGNYLTTLNTIYIKFNEYAIIFILNVSQSQFA